MHWSWFSLFPLVSVRIFLRCSLLCCSAFSSLLFCCLLAAAPHRWTMMLPCRDTDMLPCPDPGVLPTCTWSIRLALGCPTRYLIHDRPISVLARGCPTHQSGTWLPNTLPGTRSSTFWHLVAHLSVLALGCPPYRPGTRLPHTSTWYLIGTWLPNTSTWHMVALHIVLHFVVYAYGCTLSFDLHGWASYWLWYTLWHLLCIRSRLFIRWLPVPPYGPVIFCAPDPADLCTYSFHGSTLLLHSILISWRPSSMYIVVICIWDYTHTGVICPIFQSYSISGSSHVIIWCTYIPQYYCHFGAFQLRTCCYMELLVITWLVASLVMMYSPLLRPRTVIITFVNSYYPVCLHVEPYYDHLFCPRVISRVYSPCFSSIYCYHDDVFVGRVGLHVITLSSSWCCIRALHGHCYMVLITLDDDLMMTWWFLLLLPIMDYIYPTLSTMSLNSGRCFDISGRCRDDGSTSLMMDCCAIPGLSTTPMMGLVSSPW